MNKPQRVWLGFLEEMQGHRFGKHVHCHAASGRLYAECLPLLHDHYTRDCATCLRARCITMSALFHSVTQVRAFVLEGAYRTGVVLCAQ